MQGKLTTSYVLVLGDLGLRIGPPAGEGRCPLGLLALEHGPIPPSSVDLRYAVAPRAGHHSQRRRRRYRRPWARRHHRR